MVLTTYQENGPETAASSQPTIRLKTSHRKLLADTLTPVSIYLSLRDHFVNSILLESSDYHSRKNSYSYICCEPIAGLELKQGLLELRYPGKRATTKVIESTGELTRLLENFTGSFRSEQEGHFDFTTNGLFGYTSYEAVQYFEDIELLNEADGIPEMIYQLYRYVLVFDHHRNELYLFEHSQGGQPSGLDRLQALVQAADFGSYNFSLREEERSNLTDEQYLEMVARAREHCLQGDTFQLVLSRRFSRKFQGDEFNVYRSLRAINPSPYLFYFDYGNFKIFGSSPEAQLTIRENKATIHPIAGTYRRTGDAVKDAALAKALTEDVKENSEHVMLVDLARNDLARHGQQVEVESFREVQYFSHVIHLVSRVTAQIEAGKRFDLLGATFPAGTLTGAPKYKAMQLIDQYEPQGRGFYGGAIGFIGLNGDYNHAILIRSFLSLGNELIFQAGAGIVAESDAASELQEVFNKTDALRKALENAATI